ncbi:hypothetical protein BsWGS_22202 [Bradybaena similaris]
MLTAPTGGDSQTARVGSCTQACMEVSCPPSHAAQSLQSSPATACHNLSQTERTDFTQTSRTDFTQIPRTDFTQIPRTDFTQTPRTDFSQPNYWSSQEQQVCAVWGGYVTEFVNARLEDITMYSSCNTTLDCRGVPNGQKYWVSFEEKSFSRGARLKAYGGQINGKGPRSGDRCVVKVFARGPGTQKAGELEVEKGQKARALAREFNTWLPKRGTRVKISYLFWAQVDDVSLVKQIFFSGRRRLSTNDIVLVEDDLRWCDEDKPGRKRELEVYMDNLGKKYTCIAKDLETFTHFTFHDSGGQLVVCDLEGVQDQAGFYLKTPVIHSREKRYGKSDLGLQGIIEVFNNHVCNELCKDLIKPCDALDSFQVDNVDNRQDVDSTRTMSCTNHGPCPGYGQVVSEDCCNNNFFSQSYSCSPSSGDSASTVEGSRSFTCSGHMSGQFVEPSAPLEQDCVYECSTLDTSAPLEQDCVYECSTLDTSAPLEQDCVYECSTLDTSQTRHNFVATWLLQEQAPNNFITSRSFQPSHRPTARRSGDTNVDNNAVVSQMMPCMTSSPANNCDNSPSADGCSKCVTDNRGNTTRDLCNNKQPSSSVSTGFWSSASSSTHGLGHNNTNTSMTTSRRCNHCQTHCLHTQNPAMPFNFNDSQVLESCGLPYHQVCSNNIHYFVDNPPPYMGTH